MLRHLLAGLVVLGPLACAPPTAQVARAPRVTPVRLHEPMRCLGDRAAPLDPGPIRAAWQALARGEQPTPLHLRRFSADACTPSWWTGAAATARCERPGPARQAWLTMPDMTVILDRSTGALRVRVEPPLLFLDGYEVVVATPWVLRTPTGERRIEGDLVRVIDDTHAVVEDDAGLAIVDLVRQRPELRLRTHAGPATRASGVVFVRDPGARLGVSAIAALEQPADGTPASAFVNDPRGKVLAQVTAAMVAVPVTTGEGRIALVGYEPGTLSTALVGSIPVRKRSYAFELPARTGPYLPRVAAEGEVIAIGFATRGALVVGSGQPTPIDLPEASRVEPAVLAGGRVAVFWDTRGGTLVIDTQTGATLARTPDGAPLIAPDRAQVLLRDPGRPPAEQALVIDAQAAVRRGPLTLTRIGRTAIPTYAGVVDPSQTCHATLLGQLPELLQYGNAWILPADLVVD